MVSEITNGKYNEEVTWPRIEEADVVVQPEVKRMSPAKKDDAATVFGKPILAAVVVAAITALGTNYINSARAEEKLSNVQRQLTSVQDDLKTEREARELALRKIVALETQLSVRQEIERLNQNLERRR